MIKICKKGHLTGFRHCGTCGADTEGQRPPFTEYPHVTVARLNRLARQKALWAENPEPSNETLRRVAQSEADKVKERRGPRVRQQRRGVFSAAKNRMRNWLRARRNA
jgi:hypothetical protein